MPILWSPDGQPVNVMPQFVKDEIEKGYRTTPPSYGSASVVAQVAPQAALVGPLNVNTASLEELVALPGVGTSIGRKIIANRPYGSLEELQAKVNQVAWTSLRLLVNVNAEVVEESDDAVDGAGEDTAV